MMIQLNRLPSLGLPVGGAVRVAAVQLKPFLRREVSGRWRLLTRGPTPPRNKDRVVFEMNFKLAKGMKDNLLVGAPDERSEL